MLTSRQTAFAWLVAALIAFAANSVLARAALAGGAADPASYTALRLVSGAATLLAIAWGRGRLGALRARADWRSAAALFVYAALFAYAYLTIDAGLGALILFGAVQVTMFAGALAAGERPGARRWIGAALGLAGLAALAAPGAAAPPVAGAALMTGAGAAWGLFSLRGRRVDAPLDAICAAFALTIPAAAALWLAAGAPLETSAAGAALAIASGALASAGGYALWYAALPRMDASLAAVAQLCVPVLALAGGMLFLGEAATARFWIATALISAGVALASVRIRRATA